jgi:hypothetical protein
MMALALILTGCFSPLNPPAASGPAGRVTFTIGGGARTVLPSVDQFEKITLSFAGKDGSEDLADENFKGDSVTVDIRTPGSWEVSVRAYSKADDPEPAAVSSEAKTVSWAGPPTTAEITGGGRFLLVPAANDKPGKLRHTVTLPKDDFSLGTGSRIQIEQDGKVLDSLDDQDFTDGERAISESIATTDLLLPAGLYVVDIRIFKNNGEEPDTVAVYRKSVAILSGLITEIDFPLKEADFLDPAAAAARVELEGLEFGKTEENDSISSIDFDKETNPPTLAITGVSEAQAVFFTLTKTGDQVVTVGGTDAGSVVQVEEGDEAGGSTASDTLAVFVAQSLDEGDKAFTLTVTEPGRSGSVTVEVTVTREAQVMGFGLYSKAAGADESKYVPVSFVGDETLNSILEHLGVAANIKGDTSYLVLIDKDQEIAPWSSDDTVSNVEITLRGIGLEGEENWKVSWDNTEDATAEGLFRVQPGTTLVLDNGITLDGKDIVITGMASTTIAMVYVKAPSTASANAAFIMRKGSKIVSAKATTSTTGKFGSAVNVYSQTSGQSYKAQFTMEGGEISGNEGYQAIVYNSNSTFIIDGGAKITGNTLTKKDGFILTGIGAAVYGGPVFLKDGEISNNTGRGIYSTLTMTGGKITGNGTNLVHTNGLAIPGAGIATTITTTVNLTITGGEISGNGKPDTIGGNIFCGGLIVLNGTVCIDDSIGLYIQNKYISLDSNFNNTGNSPIPVFLIGSTASVFKSNWKKGKPVLQGMGETLITETLANQFKLEGGYRADMGSSFTEFTKEDITGLYIGSDGTIQD